MTTYSASTADSTPNKTATLIANTYLGNLSNSEALAKQVQQKQADGHVLTVYIEQTDRSKGRIFTKTDCGQAVGIVKSRDWSLADGDVLATQTDSIVRVALYPQKVIALRFAPSAENLAVHLVHLGHVLGNHHWPIRLIGSTLYVEQVADIELMQSTLQETVNTFGIQGLQIAAEAKPSNEAIDFKTAHHPEHSHSHAHAH
ncbi:MAG: urease accessory protein UreE [Cyanobacteria bacterium J06606_4]